MIRIATTLAVAGLIAGCAAAQPYPGGPPPAYAYDHDQFWRQAPQSPGQRVNFLQGRIDRAVSRGYLSPHQAGGLAHDLDRIRHHLQEMHYRDGGPLDPRQHADIEARLNGVSQHLSYLVHRNEW